MLSKQREVLSISKKGYLNFYPSQSAFQFPFTTLLRKYQDIFVIWTDGQGYKSTIKMNRLEFSSPLVRPTLLILAPSMTANRTVDQLVDDSLNLSHGIVKVRK